MGHAKFKEKGNIFHDLVGEQEDHTAKKHMEWKILLHHLCGNNLSLSSSHKNSYSFHMKNFPILFPSPQSHPILTSDSKSKIFSAKLGSIENVFLGVGTYKISIPLLYPINSRRKGIG